MASQPSDGPTGDGRASGIWSLTYDALGHVGGLILAVMAGAVFLQVVVRYLGFAGLDGLEEVPRFLFIWLVMIGAASAMYRGQHTVLDYFVNRLSTRSRALVLIVTNTVGIGLFAYLIKLSLVLVPNAQLQTSPGLQLPLGWVFAAVPFGSALIILPMLRTIFMALRQLWQRPS